jgi:peptidyl-prolyl cis-trans isomerase A (cyclophilin A)
MLRQLLILLSLISFHLWAAPSVEFETTLGRFTIELNQEKAPVTVANFLRYVKDESYVGSIFHRVIPGFMVQGGGFNQQMKRLKTYSPIRNEANNGLHNQAGTIAMARTKDPNSATRQFFINLVDNKFLDYDQRPPGYAVFGRVTSGFEVIKAIGKQPTTNLGYMKNIPEEPIVITRVSLIEKTKDQ